MNSAPAPRPPSRATGNTLRQNLLSTGAFEVSYDGTLIWSKLSTGRMPALGDLVTGIGEAMAAARGDAVDPALAAAAAQ